MDYEDTLVGLYVYICDHFESHLFPYVMRLSNNHQPRFTDEEVLTVYLFGVLRGLRELSSMHAYAREHLACYFPRLPGYGAFVQRLNRLAEALPALAGCLSQELCRSRSHEPERMVDSMPVIVAGGLRSTWSRAAKPLADKGRSASKGFFYGVKLHVIVWRRRGHLPLVEWVQMAPASVNDLTALKQCAPRLGPGQLFADKIYLDRPWSEQLRAHQQLEVITPAKRARGQEFLLLTQRAYSAAVSRARQAIESFFAWLQELTGIQNASHVRSANGLIVHVFGCLTAALYVMTVNP